MGDEFNRLMQEAVNLKTAQLSKLRKSFDQWPQFHQAGLYYEDRFSHLRTASLEEQLTAHREKKAEAAEFFKKGEHQTSVYRYEEALCILRWVENSRGITWKNEGIEDGDLTIRFVELTPESTAALISVYLDLSLANLRIEAFKESQQASDEALLLDQDCVKALYRKALAITGPAGSSLDDVKEAVALLKTAIRIEPSNRTIRDKYTEYKSFLSQQQIKSKETFGSFFRKPGAFEDYNPKPETSEMSAKEFIEKSEAAMKDLASSGEMQRARAIKSTLKEAKRHMKKAKAQKPSQPPPVDFDNPTQQMREEAKRFGLDLSDPTIRAELNRLKENNGKATEDTPPPPEYDITPTEKKNDWHFSIIFLVVFCALILMI